MSRDAVLSILKALSHDIRGAGRAVGLRSLGVDRRPPSAPPAPPLALPPLLTSQLSPPPASSDLDVGSTVDRHQKLPVVQFLRDYVAANKPVVLTSACIFSCVLHRPTPPAGCCLSSQMDIEQHAGVLAGLAAAVGFPFQDARPVPPVR